MLGLLQCKIQKGRSTGGNVTISAVSDITKCAVFCTGNGSAYLSNANTLVVTVLSTYGQGTVDWQVIEFGGAVV